MNHLKSLLKQKIAMYEKLVKFTWLKFEATNNQLWLSKHKNVCDGLYSAKLALEAVEAKQANFTEASNSYLSFIGVKAYNVVSLNGEVIYYLTIENA